MSPTLSELLHDDFSARHIGPQGDDLAAMLATIGVGSVADLIDQTVPESIRLREPLDLVAAVSEPEVLAALREIAAENRPMRSLIGMGYTGTHTPPVIRRNVLENPAWYTAYTPYQPEISQGRLEALLNFQTMVADLTGLDIANASLLDEATAAAEAMTMARRSSKADGNRFFVHHDTHPQTLAVLATRADPLGLELVIGDVDAARRRPLLRCPVQLSHLHRCGHRLDRCDRDGEGFGCTHDRRDRSAGVCAAPLAGCARRRHRGRFGATVRCPDGIRRTPCRVRRGA